MSDLATDIVEYLRGERRRMTRQELALRIVKEAAHNAAWPRASYEAWEAAIASAVKAGALQSDGQTVWLADKPVEEKHEQMELF